VQAAHSPRLFLSTSGAIYALVFIAFLFLERPGLGIGHFYYLAIALVALALGPIWGAAAGGFATALYATGVSLNHTLPTNELFAFSSPIRFVTFVAVGTLLGWVARRYQAVNAELQILAQRDSVTGLPNTRAFELAIDRRLLAGKPFALLVADLDTLRFDADRDQALRHISDVLSRAVGPEADVARVGGDAFAVLASCGSVEDAGQLASQLERNLSEGGSLATFGWSAFPQEGENALTLYRAADERLYARRVLRDPRARAVHAVGV